MLRRGWLAVAVVSISGWGQASAQGSLSQGCRFMAPDGPACIYGRALRASRAPLRLDGALHLVRDLRPDNGGQPFLDLEMLIALWERRAPEKVFFPAQAAFDAALAAAYEHDAGSFDRSADARRHLHEAVRLQQQYRIQAANPRMPPTSQDRAVAEVYASIVDFLLGQRAAARTRMLAAGTQFSAAKAPVEVRLPGPTNLSAALQEWLEATWDVGPVAHFIDAVEDVSERQLLLQESLAVSAMVPRFPADRERLAAQARREVAEGSMPLEVIQWAVRGAADCDQAMRALDGLDLSQATFRSPSPTVNGHATSRKVNAALRPLHEAWRGHFCKLTLPHHHLTLSSAWKSAFDAVAAAPAPGSDLIDAAARGRAARVLALYAADLRSATRVGAAFGLPVAPLFGSLETMPMAWFGFMGAGSQVVSWADRPVQQAQVVGMSRPRLAALAALGAGYGGAYGLLPGATVRVSERVPGVQWQPCAVPVMAVGPLYSPANITRAAGMQPSAICTTRIAPLADAARSLDSALAGMRHAQCDAMAASTSLNVSSASYAAANNEVLDEAGQVIEEALVGAATDLQVTRIRKSLAVGGESFALWTQAFDIAEPIAKGLDRVKLIYGAGKVAIAVIARADAKGFYQRDTAAARAADERIAARRLEAASAQSRLVEQQDAFLGACLP